MYINVSYFNFKLKVPKMVISNHNIGDLLRKISNT